MKTESEAEFNALEPPKVNRVRELVQRHLSRLSSTTGIFVAESYLLKDGRLSGIKFSLGPFYAQWDWGDKEISIVEREERGEPQKLGTLAIGTSTGTDTHSDRIAA